jgi:hypothetical protein
MPMFLCVDIQTWISMIRPRRCRCRGAMPFSWCELTLAKVSPWLASLRLSTLAKVSPWLAFLQLSTHLFPLKIPLSAWYALTLMDDVCARVCLECASNIYLTEANFCRWMYPICVACSTNKVKCIWFTDTLLSRLQDTRRFGFVRWLCSPCTLISGGCLTSLLGHLPLPSD